MYEMASFGRGLGIPLPFLCCQLNALIGQDPTYVVEGVYESILVNLTYVVVSVYESILVNSTYVVECVYESLLVKGSASA